MKIYVSLPITGYDESERRRKCASIKNKLMGRYGAQTRVTTPFDIADVLRTKGEPTYGDYLGADVRFILDEADAICVYVKGGEFPDSKGVHLEYCAATLYGKKVLFIDD